MTDRLQSVAERAEACFAAIEAAAAAGARCPMNGTHGVDQKLVGRLCRDGRLFVEVYAFNFRRARVLTGPHAGKETAPPPKAKWRPYVTIGTETRHYGRRFTAPTAAARQPSAPRPLTSSELRRLP